MTEPRHCIVVALDLGDYAEIVLEHALDQAARHDVTDLHFVYVHERSALDLEEAKDDSRRWSCLRSMSSTARTGGSRFTCARARSPRQLRSLPERCLRI
jgi:hypothetical protein